MDFDYVFLHTRQAYCWGSPDILRIFDKGTSKNIHSFSYDANQIDFGEKDPSRLDMWVFNEVNKFLTRTQRTEEEEALLRKDETVFFLHLLGIDTSLFRWYLLFFFFFFGHILIDRNIFFVGIIINIVAMLPGNDIEMIMCLS